MPMPDMPIPDKTGAPPMKGPPAPGGARGQIEAAIQKLIDGGMSLDDVKAKSEAILLEGLTALSEETPEGEEEPPAEEEPEPPGLMTNPLDAIMAARRGRKD